MDSRKIKSFIGFAIKAKKAVFGSENAAMMKAHIVLIDNTLSQNSSEKLKTRLEGKHIEYILVDGLNELTSRESCKAVGICEKNLACAIANELKGEH